VEGKMKIVIGVTYAYPYVGSGIGNVAMKQAEELAKKGHSVTLISSNYPESKMNFKRKGVRHLKSKKALRLEKIGLPIPLFSLTQDMKKAIKKADVVHIHGSLYPSSYQIAKFAKKNNKRIILTQHIGLVGYHGFLYRMISVGVYKTMAKKIFEFSDKILVLNSKVKNDLGLFKVEASKIVIVPNGVDSSLFKPAVEKKKKELRKKHGLPLDKEIVLFVGRLVPVKAFERLFEARDEDYLALFVGGGDVPENMRNNPDALFIGEKTPEELVEFYQLSDFFVLPSKSEGFPLSVLEAMSCGLPVIVSKLPVYKEYFKKTDLKVISPTPRNIRKNIKSLLKNKKLRRSYAFNSRKTILKKFDWDKNVSSLLDVYTGRVK
jgi:glycosyltransferase involved in cell wall biosynthesis